MNQLNLLQNIVELKKQNQEHSQLIKYTDINQDLIKHGKKEGTTQNKQNRQMLLQQINQILEIYRNMILVLSKNIVNNQIVVYNKKHLSKFPFSTHQINKTDFLFKSLWASLPLILENLLFRYTQWWDALLITSLSFRG